METIIKPKTPINHEEEKDFKKSKTPQNEKEIRICVDHDSEEDDEYYYDLSDSYSDSIEDFFEECKDELWKIE